MKDDQRIREGPTTTGTCSGPVLGLAAIWIANCVETHSDCSKDFDSSFLPTRLITIIDKHGTRIAKVEETIPDSASIPYVALSYCWGGESNVRLLTSNYERLSRQGLHIDELPSTMRQAIDLTDHLGKRHIWIDALCIIQDDSADWAHEAGLMADVYANSFLTIAAWGASSCNQGLFTIRNPLLLTSCKLYDGLRHSTMCAELAKDALDVPHDLKSCDRSPLYKRGWVMQERLFAPRTLNVGAFIAWECKSGSCSELEPVLYKGHNYMKSLFREKGYFEPPSVDADVFLRNWREQILPTFTQSGLTRQRDRLVAISGTIRKLGLLRGLRNIHGLWEQYLVEELQWIRSQTDSSVRCKRSGVGPSWSWANIDGPVEYSRVTQLTSHHRGYFNFKGVITKVLFVDSSSITNGEVWYEFGALIFKGQLFELMLEAREPQAQHLSSVLDAFIGGQKTPQKNKWTFWSDVDDLPCVTNPTWFFLLQTFVDESLDEKKREATALALIEVVNKPGFYQRIGYVGGRLRDLPKELRLQFEQTSTQEITII